MLSALQASAQTFESSGVIKDIQGVALPGVSVIESGTLNGTITDVDGTFTLKVNTGAVLQISCVGYTSLSMAAAQNMVITMEENTEFLDELVVIGYGAVSKRDLTTAVGSVSNKEINERPITSAMQAIQGKVAGVQVTEPSGAPGADLSIRVRGTTSLNGSNAPLYVVDGVPVDNLKFLAPGDIDNIQIMKDASGAAIYGSRAANGVVLITTKTGQTGQAKLSFNAYAGLSKISNPVKSLNAEEYDDLMSELGYATFGTGDVTDWQKEIYRTGLTQNYQMTLSDGNDKMKYFLSGNMTDDKGIIKTTYHKRYSFRAKLDAKVNKWLEIGVNGTYSRYGKNGVTTGLPANRGGFVLAAVNLPTASKVWDDAMGAYNRNFNGLNLTNPVEALENGKNNKGFESRILLSGNATATLFPGLTFKSQFTMDRIDANSSSFTPPTYIEEESGVHGSRVEYGSASDNRSITDVYVFDNVLTYNGTFGKHQLTAMAGTSWTSSDYTNSYISGSHYRNADIQTLNAANMISWDGTGTAASQWKILSGFSRLSYSYDSRYLITANFRADGSSKLHPDHRWGYFPSFSAAWRISSEKFMESVKAINDMKLRVSWGQTGNQSGVGDYAYLQTYSVVRSDWTQTGHRDDLPGISVNQLRNSDLTWETTSQYDAGLDLSMFAGRLVLNMDYYYKCTSDMLMYVTLPSGQATDNIIRNEGVMTNKGFELSVNTVNLTGDFEWLTNFNISFNRNRLESLELQQTYTAGYINSEIMKDNVVRNEPGRSLGGFYGYKCEGVNPDTGELMYADLDGKEGLTPADMTYIGDPNPDFIFGFTNTFTYKNLSLNVFFNGSYGNDIYNASRIETESMTTQRNQSRAVLKRWRNPGDQTSVPKAGTTVMNSSYYVEDGSYLRLKTLTLSYDFSGSRLQRFGIRAIKPYVTANNLWTLTKYNGVDPEVNEFGSSGAAQGIDFGTYPYRKSFLIGVNVEF